MIPSPRDLQAQAALDALGLSPYPTGASVAELTPARAVRVALAWHLARLEARVEEGAPLRPVYTGDEWKRGTEPAAYPSLVVLSRSTREMDAEIGVPMQLDGRDLISPDEVWALWHQGEDAGEGVVHVFAAHKPQRDALARAIEDTLGGSIDRLQSLGLALPEAFLPTPFREVLPVERLPRCRVALAGPSSPVDDGLAASGGVWRADVPFFWQAPRLAARRRIPDLRSEVVVSVAAPSEA